METTPNWPSVQRDDVALNDPGRLIDFACAWASLGDAITSQIVEMLNPTAGGQDEEPPSMSGGALGYARERLGGFSDELDQLFDELFRS